MVEAYSTFVHCMYNCAVECNKIKAKQDNLQKNKPHTFAPVCNVGIYVSIYLFIYAVLCSCGLTPVDRGT